MKASVTYNISSSPAKTAPTMWLVVPHIMCDSACWGDELQLMFSVKITTTCTKQRDRGSEIKHKLMMPDHMIGRAVKQTREMRTGMKTKPTKTSVSDRRILSKKKYLKRPLLNSTPTMMAMTSEMVTTPMET